MKVNARQTLAKARAAAFVEPKAEVAPQAVNGADGPVVLAKGPAHLPTPRLRRKRAETAGHRPGVERAVGVADGALGALGQVVVVRALARPQQQTPKIVAIAAHRTARATQAVNGAHGAHATHRRLASRELRIRTAAETVERDHGIAA